MEKNTNNIHVCRTPLRVLVHLLMGVLLAFPLALQAQTTPLFAEPSINVGFGLASRWSANTALVWRQQLGSFQESRYQGFSQTDVIELQLFVNYQLLGSRRIAFGYLYGAEEPFLNQNTHEHRLMQQFSFRLGNAFSWMNRVRIEQRISEGQFRNRLRYRFNVERPLSGAKIDAGEFYAVAGNELLYTFTFQPGEDRFDNRLGAGLGYLFKNGHKLQMEFQHRWQRIGSAGQNHALHILMAVQLKY